MTDLASCWQTVIVWKKVAMLKIFIGSPRMVLPHSQNISTKVIRPSRCHWICMASLNIYNSHYGLKWVWLLCQNNHSPDDCLFNSSSIINLLVSNLYGHLKATEVFVSTCTKQLKTLPLIDNSTMVFLLHGFHCNFFRIPQMWITFGYFDSTCPTKCPFGQRFRKCLKCM